MKCELLMRCQPQVGEPRHETEQRQPGLQLSERRADAAVRDLRSPQSRLRPGWGAAAAGLDVGYTRFFVEAAAPRVTCRQHGVVVAQVPWARRHSRFLWVFEDQVAWLATQCSQKACSQLMLLDWETVGRIITRVVEETSRTHDRLDGLQRIGIDEISWRRGQRYLTLVIDHASGRLVWAAEGRSKKVVESFFAQLGPDRCAQLTHVSSDGAEWILAPIGQALPQRDHLPGSIPCGPVGDERARQSAQSNLA